MNIVVRQVDAATVRPLRHDVLRPGRALDESNYPVDSTAVHLAAYDDERIVGVATIFPEPTPDEAKAWRLRGMAVDPGLQRSGVGTLLLQRAFGVLEQRRVPLLWCNARVPAVPFYERQGFVAIGEPFDVAGIGMHVVMRRAINQHSA